MNGRLPRSEYVGTAHLAELQRGLSARDHELLSFLSRHRYATTTQLCRTFFHDHATATASTRACVRVMHRLLRDRLVTRLERRVGGRSRGSAAFIWHLDAAGERLTRNSGTPRRRFTDPALPFLDHSLQITDTHVALIGAARTGDFTLEHAEIETEAWRTYLNRHGVSTVLKPDMFVTLSTAEYDDHWYLEIDRGTESLPVLLAKCRAYAAYRRTGRAQAEHGVLPRVLWILPTQRRAARLLAAIAAAPGLDDRLFTAITPDEAIPTLTGEHDTIMEGGAL